MSTGETSGPTHPVPAIVGDREYRYQFYTKHRGGDLRAAQWSVSQDVEFDVFNLAVLNDLSDERGNFYGVSRDFDGDDLLELGTWGQQVAEFPLARVNESWHGYPSWPVDDDGPQNRRGQEFRPSKEVFNKMESQGIISKKERRRLDKGDPA
jgi:hypothetical protein